MKIRKSIAPFMVVAIVLMASVAISTSALNAAEIELPSKMVWSSYDLGSAGHTEASGMANALQKHFKTRIRIVPSGTSIGRLLPMTTGRVTYGFLGNEAFFASEATFDFSAKRWGPQNLRVLMGRPSPIGIAMTNCEKRPVKTPADFKGLRLGFVKGNPSVNVKNDAMLAFGNLTRDDIKVVWFGGYGQQFPALLSGQLDGVSSVPTSSFARQVEASPGGLCWPEMHPKDKAGWARAQAIAGFLKPVKATSGAGLSEANPKWMAGYRYPVLSTYAKTPADEVYNLMKALHKYFDDYKSTTAASKGWAMNEGGRPPYDAPTHEGAVRFLKEIGVWTAADQAWNEVRLARVEKVQGAWDNAVEEYDAWRVEQKKKGKRIKGDSAWLEFWAKYRAKHLDK